MIVEHPWILISARILEPILHGHQGITVKNTKGNTINCGVSLFTAEMEIYLTTLDLFCASIISFSDWKVLWKVMRHTWSEVISRHLSAQSTYNYGIPFLQFKCLAAAGNLNKWWRRERHNCIPWSQDLQSTFPAVGTWIQVRSPEWSLK